MAVEDFDAAAKGINVEIVSADHQNKPDVGSNIARQWYDQDGVDVIVDVPTSSVGARGQRDHPGEEQGLPQLRRRLVRPDRQGLLAEHHPLDLRHLGARPTAPAAPWSKAGGDTWFFLTADYAFGHALERDTERGRRGSRRQGARHGPPPLPRPGLLLLPAAGAGLGAKVIGLANAGGDTINSIKQAAEFGITQGGQKLAGLLIFITDVQRSACRPRRGWC